jgi:hypothetical protein
LKHRLSQDGGLRAAAVFILAISTVHLVGQTYQLLSALRNPRTLAEGIAELEMWFDGLTVQGYQYSAPAVFPLILILLSIIAIALLERKPNKPDFVQ